MRAQLVRDLHNYDPRVTNKSEIGIPKFHIRCPNISPFTYDLDTIRNTCNVFVSVLPLPLSSLRLLFFDMPYHVWYFCHYLKIPSPPPLLLSDLPCQRWSLHHHYPHHHHHHHCHGKGGVFIITILTIIIIIIAMTKVEASSLVASWDSTQQRLHCCGLKTPQVWVQFILNFAQV